MSTVSKEPHGPHSRESVIAQRISPKVGVRRALSKASKSIEQGIEPENAPLNPKSSILEIRFALDASDPLRSTAVANSQRLKHCFSHRYPCLEEYFRLL